MKCITAYRILTVVILFASCSERITVSDADSLGLRFKVKSMNESFYIAGNSFNRIVLYEKIYHHKYVFHNDCRFKSVEKKFCLNKPVADTLRPDSAARRFPFAFKEPDCYTVNYKYISDALTTLEICDKHGNMKQYINRQYENRRLISEEKYSDSGKLTVKSNFWYDSKNRLLNKTVFYENGYRETVYSYSTGEKLETSDEFNYRYRFDIHGRIVNKKTYRGASHVSETSFEYNSHGDVIAIHEINKNGMIKKILYDYTYDANNNWTLCVEYNYTGNIFVRKREITYYN